jgi:hypothetical protein
VKGPRLRQAVLVARDLDSVSDQIRTSLGLGEPYHDPGVAAFGLANSVFAVGNSFLEVVSPIQEGTTAGRYLERHGGDSGYMAMFQMPDMEATEKRIADLGIRIVWRGDYPDIAGRHLHPKDIGGAIVSLDWADPPDSWRWAGPDWTAQTPQHPPGGIAGLTVRVRDPKEVADRWASALDEKTSADGSTIELDEGRQRVRFTTADDEADEGVSEVIIGAETPRADTSICGVRFSVEPLGD